MKLIAMTWDVQVCCNQCGNGPRKAVADWDAEANRPVLVDWPMHWRCEDDGSVTCSVCVDEQREAMSR